MVMATPDPNPEVPAGDFGPWLADTEAAMRGDRDATVPCGGCKACCESFQFVHVEPDENETRAHIPAGFLFPAPGRPVGHMVMGYDESGRCPMLRADGCSIYEHRPRACRRYDCRVFAAAEINIAGSARWEPIAERVVRWRFGYPGASDDVAHRAVRAASAFLERTPDLLAGSGQPAGRALAAIRIHRLFLQEDGETGRQVVVDPDRAVVEAELAHLGP